MADGAEAALAKRLCHTLKAQRDAGFAVVAQWVAGRGDDDGAAEALETLRPEFLKLWKALFYTMWMSDKVPVQQELALRLAGLLRGLHGSVRARRRGVAFAAAFFETMRREWIGLDRFRVDKFLSLVRRVTCETLGLARASAAVGDTDAEAGVISVFTHAFCAPPNGVRIHLASCFVTELAASGAGETTAAALRMLEPVFTLLRSVKEREPVAAVAKELLSEGLLSQLEVGRSSVQGADSHSEEAMIGGAAEAPAPAPPIRGMPKNASATPHAAELAVLFADRAVREATTARAMSAVNVAAIARELFAVGADKATHPPNRVFAYAAHAEFTALALKLGDAKDEGECGGVEGVGVGGDAAAAEGAGVEVDAVVGAEDAGVVKGAMGGKGKKRVRGGKGARDRGGPKPGKRRKPAS